MGANRDLFPQGIDLDAIKRPHKRGCECCEIIADVTIALEAATARVRELEGCREEGYVEGTADERAAVVAYLNERDPGGDCFCHSVYADVIEAGQHVKEKK